MGSPGEPAEGERVIYHRPAGAASARDEGTVVRNPLGAIEVQLDQGAGTVAWEPARTHLASRWADCPECRQQQGLNVGAAGI